MKGSKFSVAVLDYFLILSAIIGVGFASGKEIYVFFFRFSGASIFGLITFALLYLYLFFVIDYVKKKLELHSYNEFNTKIFGQFCKISNIVMLVNFLITSGGMLAGADYLFSTFFNIHYRIPSIALTIITLIILLGGINKIKVVSNVIIPVMLATIIINSLVNITPQNVNLELVKGNIGMATYYGLLFGVNNFVVALPVLFETKLKSKGKIFVIFTICMIILSNILVLASQIYVTDMPMFEASINVSKGFYYIYFITLILALFSTLIICSYNTQSIISRGKNSVWISVLVVIINLLISNFGYAFIVNYLYVLSGFISGLYVVTLVILMTINLIKSKKKTKNSKKN